MTNLVLQHSDRTKPQISLKEFGRDASTSVIFDGYYSKRYAKSINEALLNILENFANSFAPTDPIEGQIWYDNITQELKYYRNSGWIVAGGIVYDTVEPTIVGKLWYKTDENQLYAYDGTQYINIGSNYYHLDGDSHVDNVLAGDMEIIGKLYAEGDLTLTAAVNVVKTLTVFTPNDTGTSLSVHKIGGTSSSTTTSPQSTGETSSITFSSGFIGEAPGEINIGDSSTTSVRLVTTDYNEIFRITSDEFWFEKEMDYNGQYPYHIIDNPTDLTSLVSIRKIVDKLEPIEAQPNGLNKDGSEELEGRLNSIFTSATAGDVLHVEPRIKFNAGKSLTLKGSNVTTACDVHILFNEASDELRFDLDGDRFLTISTDPTAISTSDDTELRLSYIDFHSKTMNNVISYSDDDIIDKETFDALNNDTAAHNAINGRAAFWLIYDWFNNTVVDWYTASGDDLTAVFGSNYNTLAVQLPPSDWEPNMCIVQTSAGGIPKYNGAGRHTIMYGAGNDAHDHARVQPNIWIDNILPQLIIRLVQTEIQYEKHYKATDTDTYIHEQMRMAAITGIDLEDVPLFTGQVTIVGFKRQY